MAHINSDSTIGGKPIATTDKATTSTDGLMSKEDKNKLDGVAPNANNYTHPANHPASIITHDANNRFVSDAEKAAWNAKQNALGFTPLNANQKGSNNGVAELDATGRVPASQLPSYVDDVLEFANLAGFPTTGETGKIYTAIDTNKIYRWSGTAYVVISDTLALGETSATAYRGDRGKVAYDHSQTTHAPSNAQKNSDITKAEIEAKLTGVVTSHTHTVTKANVGLGNVDNTSDANKPVSTAQAAAIALKIDASKFQVVTELPASPVTGVFYFIKE